MSTRDFLYKKYESVFKASWKGNVMLSLTESDHSRGVAMLFKQHFQGEVISSFSSNDGRILLINIEFQGNILSIVSVYAPPHEVERMVFFEKLTEWILKYADNVENIIFPGDLNCCLFQSDRSPATTRNGKSAASFAKLLLQCKVNDSWLLTNLNIPGYTYYDKKCNSYYIDNGQVALHYANLMA